jgi:hypothetical protein
MTADATAAAAALPVHTGTFAALRYGGYRRLLLGTTLANGGQWLQQVTVSWLAYDITGSGTSVGTVNLFRSFATLGSAPWAGLAVDRVFAAADHRDQPLAGNSAPSWGLLMGGERHLWLLFAFASAAASRRWWTSLLRQAAVFLLVHGPSRRRGRADADGVGLMGRWGPRSAACSSRWWAGRELPAAIGRLRADPPTDSRSRSPTGGRARPLVPSQSR